ncbi:MAG: hypothetical protein IKK11_05260 [Oscillospiraceae bacterium]|nr:hypothetical protein [Oscillospiraceae bacterium]
MKKEEMCQEIFKKLMEKLPSAWEGKETILYMKKNGCRNWRQMEWPGWYFQFMCETVLSKEGFFSIPGPSYGNVEFDGKRNIPWDFKAHTSNASGKNKVPTNGYQEVMAAIEEYGCVGFMIASGNAIFDDANQTFKKWHDELKGKTSDYEKERIARGAPSRRRKASFKLDAIYFIFVDKDTIQYCGSFQGGMRNSNGVPRNPKVMIDVSDSRLEQYKFTI